MLRRLLNTVSESASTVLAGREFHSGIVLRTVPLHKGEFLSEPIRRSILYLCWFLKVLPSVGRWRLILPGLISRRPFSTL